MGQNHLIVMDDEKPFQKTAKDNREAYCRLAGIAMQNLNNSNGSAFPFALILRRDKWDRIEVFRLHCNG